MTTTVRRTFTTLVFALVAALIMPLAASATVPPVDGAITHDEIGASTSHDSAAGPAGLADELLNATEDDLEGPVEIEIPVPSDPNEADLPNVVRPEADENPEVPLDSTPEPADGDERDGEGAAVDEENTAEELVEVEPLDTVAVKGRATHIAAGSTHSLYLDGEGQIWAWGQNDHGGLGNGTTTSSTVPVRVTMDSVLEGVEIVAVAAGYFFSMALDSEGRVYTWGLNTDGVLGDGTLTSKTTPVRVGGLLASQRVVQIGAAGTLWGGGVGPLNAAAALAENGRVYTWGSGARGQLGNGTTTARQTTPVLVGGLLANERVVDLDIGVSIVAAVTDRGRVLSWGLHMSGSLGNGSSGTVDQLTPAAVDVTGVLAGVRIVQVAVATDGVTALSDQGEVFSWGLNSSGQLGNGIVGGHASLPVRADMAAFEAIGNVPVQIAGALHYRLALGAHGRVATWGNLAFVGGGAGTSTTSALAVEVGVDGVMGGANIIQVSAGTAGTVLALADDGRVFAWGRGDMGTLGDGGTSHSDVPVQAGGLRVVTEPADASVPHGAQGTFTAESGGVPASVRWELSTDGGESWSALEGATSTTFTTPPATLEMGGQQYRAVFTAVSELPPGWENVVISGAATLTVDGPPVVTVHPSERVRSLAGLDVVLDADAEGAAPMTVQWQSSADGETWVDVPGATERAHTFVATEDLHGTLYRAVFTNPSGIATTNTALLEVVAGAPSAHLAVTPQVRHVSSLEATVR